MAEYSTLIPQNVAVKGARRIGIYNRKGNRVGFIPLGSLAKPNGRKLYSFGALSDVHYQYETGADDFRNALTYLNHTEKVAFTCICGDLTRNGTDAELNEYKTAVSAHSPNTPVYAIAGNHDTYQGLHDSIANYTGKPLYYTFAHGDDVFIMMGLVGEAENALFRTEMLQWLYETLEANRNKRCFLFQHIPTYEGSGDCLKVYGGTKLRNAVTSTVFKSLLSHYPNVIHFHGHTHMRYRLQEYGDNANYDNHYGCHSVHIPALAVQRDSTGSGFVSYIQGSEGYVVDVYENGIHLRGRDFVNGEFLPIASYWLDTTPKAVGAGMYADNTGTITTQIPAEYQQVEWIGATGTQYIDTGIIPSNHMVEVRYSMDSYVNDAHLFGTAAGSSNKWFHFTIYNNRYNWGLDGTGEQWTPTGTWTAGVKTLLFNYGDNHEVVQDGVVLGSGHTINSTKNLTLCRRTKTSFVGNYYYFKVTDRATGLLVRNLIPCYRKTDFVIGMYDTISRQFFTNSGTGTFTKGADIVMKYNIPSEYQRVEYIEATGTQYINTDIIPSNHMIEVKYSTDEYVDDSHLFGTALSWQWFHFTLHQNKYKFGLSGTQVTGLEWSAGIKTLLFNYGDNHEVIQDGVVFSSGKDIYSTESVTLCRRNVTKFYGKYYYFNITDRTTGALVRNMIPCYRKADGVVGMYDTVSKQFFVNLGTGEFGKGADV